MQWIRWHYFWINLYQSHCILCHLFLTNLRIYFKCHLFLWIVTVIFYIPLIPNYKPPHKTKFYAPSTSLHRNMDPVRYILVTLLCLDLHSQEIRQHSKEYLLYQLDHHCLLMHRKFITSLSKQYQLHYTDNTIIIRECKIIQII